MEHEKQKIHTPSGRWRAGLWSRVLFQRHPRYWALGLVLMFCHALGRLPLPLLLWIGRGLGRLGMCSGKLRHIAESNLRVCFPSLSDGERKQLLRDSFSELGMSVVESFKAWFDDPAKKFGSTLTVEGLEHLQQAMDSKQGIILVSCHNGCLDFNVTLMASLVRGHRPFAYTYRQPTDPVVDRFIRDARSHLVETGLSIRNLVGISRVLKKGGIVWYAPDIEVHNKNAAFVDFMGVPASTTQAVSRIALSAGALVVSYGHYRNADNRSYTVKIWPALENLPSKDAVADTAEINKALEKVILRFPERYWWVIKRFKHRPPGEPKVY